LDYAQADYIARNLLCHEAALRYPSHVGNIPSRGDSRSDTLREVSGQFQAAKA
jgi:hypothetical protein